MHRWLFIAVAATVTACSGPTEEDDRTITVCTALECAQADMADSADAGADVQEQAPDSGTATPDAAPDLEDRPVLVATESYEADILYGWVAAGQPTEARLEEVVATGATIISLRLPAEDPFDEPGLIASLGGTFIRYPVSPTDYDSVAFREAMYDLYDAELDAGNIVYLHCASSNRVGASWALYQAERKGVDGEEAIAMGRAAGLGSLETRVREILGL